MIIQDFKKLLANRYDYISKIDAIKLGCRLGMIPIDANVAWKSIYKYQD